jgi:hypothetical protein
MSTESQSDRFVEQALPLLSMTWGATDDDTAEMLGRLGFRVADAGSRVRVGLIRDFAGADGVDGNYAVSDDGLQLVSLFGVQGDRAALVTAERRVAAAVTEQLGEPAGDADGVRRWDSDGVGMELTSHDRDGAGAMLQLTFEPA